MTNTKENKKKTPKGQQQQREEQEHTKTIDTVAATNGETTKTVEEESHPFLGHELRVELSDHRVVVGTLIAYMGIGDLLLQNAVEQRRYADGELSWRPLTLVAVPMRFITAMHRRLPDCEPIALVEA
ncbi:uncharacterized protein TM35_000101390 [Trypanosoma theileri]|uniref:Uncharacterized protein n=1 Tax=Trypanosoma theileri TaxID=67003 RepID=A0A1X0NZ50_9TRYP|nr:uncharacterized protein TM35_000101390 [Trypanosoma theileri]ORC89871.1 hypothetical protein TM35_000101390 [Trypanosoma theileri]